jgi:membrane protease YdiL (CAAX protease family)
MIGPTGIEFKLWAIAAIVIAILLPLWAAVRLLGLEAKQALNLVRPSWWRTTLAVVLGFALALAFNMLWPRIIAPTPQYLESTRAFIVYDGIVEFVLVFLLVVVAAPLADELLFRGFLLRAWSARYGGVAAVLLTALATALFHTWEPFKLGHAFVMGIIFATAVLWTRSVATSFVLHALLNAMALLPAAG